MLNSVPVMIFIGILLGFLSGLGIGGGSLLILWLTMVLGQSPETARSTNLLFFIPSSLIACIMRMQKGELELHPILPAVLSGCAAAILFSFVSERIDTAILKKLFGAVLIAAGIREIFYRPRKAR